MNLLKQLTMTLNELVKLKTLWTTRPRLKRGIDTHSHVCLCWGFTAKSTQWGPVKCGQFIKPLFLGRLLTSIVHILSPETDKCPSWISGRERMSTENISWSISTKECCQSCGGQTCNLLIIIWTPIQLSHQGQLAHSLEATLLEKGLLSQLVRTSNVHYFSSIFIITWTL